MRKNLLLTTALVGVAFAFPAMANEAENPPAEETAIYTNETGKTVADGTIFNGLANTTVAQQAGAVTVDTQGSIVIGNNVQFTGNSSDWSGGAMKALSGFEIGNKAEFKNNISNQGGGALYIRQSPNTGSEDAVASTTAKIGDNATFSGNKAGGETASSWLGGAIAVEYAPEGLEIGDGATFSKNEAQQGGAIAVWVSENEIEGKKASTLTIGDGATFSENKANGVAGNGGALFVNDGAQATLGRSTFEKNVADNAGGAIFVGPNVREELGEGAENYLQIASGSEFTGNNAKLGGAIYSNGHIGALDNVTFKGNYAVAGGGAILNSAGTIDAITNSTFEGNYSESAGGAIYNKGSSTSGDASIGLINNTTFKDNHTTKGNGGAIFNGGTTTSSLVLDNVTFDGNHAGATDGKGGAGGAISASGDVTINNSTFTNNYAATDGGALNVVDGAIAFTGENTFSNNKIVSSGTFEDSTTYNDINLQKETSTINVDGTLTLDGGIDGQGKANFADNSTLNITTHTTIGEDVVMSTGSNVSLGLIVDKGVSEATFNLDNITLAEEGTAGFNLSDNALYNVNVVEGADSQYTLTKKSDSELASSLGVAGSQATALASALSGEASSNEAFNGFTDALNTAIQSANKGQVAAAANAIDMLTADANPVVRTVETDIHNMVFSAVNDELNGEGGAIAEGKSSGDTFKQVKAWIRGLFNRADHESTSKASGFDADIYGVAMGIDKQINNAVKLGVGYAYSQADISSGIRDTDVDTHTAILYGQYRPANWYINTVVAYNWSDYDEKKAALGYSADASYDVESLGIQSMYGYETKLGEYDLTPEAGLRYAHISRDGYTDALGTSVASDDSDILTAVVGAKVAKDYTIGCNTIVRPELKAAVTYDLFDDGNNSYVSLANGSAYRVNGEKLDRLGFEFGAKVATEVSDNLEISAGWEGRFREDYQDHTAMLNAKYSF